MQVFAEALLWAQGRPEVFQAAVVRHIELSAAALAIALVIAAPAGALIARRTGFAEPVIGFFNGVRVVPSLAILFLAVPVLGIGFAPALLALTALACPPILLNTHAAFSGVDESVVEAARGMGMSDWQIYRRVELPLAAPVIITGVRAASVEVIASATLAAFIGAGGLGDFVTLGYALGRQEVMLVGAVPVAVLTLISEAGLSAVERGVQVA